MRVFGVLLKVAVGCVRSVDAESLKYCDGSWFRAPARDNFSICQSYPTIFLTQPTAIPSINVIKGPGMRIGWSKFSTEQCCDKVIIGNVGTYSGSSPGTLTLPGSEISVR